MTERPSSPTWKTLRLQLKQGGARAHELRAAAQCYAYAATLFGRRRRGGDRALLDHLVGTARLLHGHGAGVEIANAGLLHRAYDLGDFGGGGPGVTAHRRHELKTMAGHDVEAVVHAAARIRAAHDGAVGPLPEPDSCDRAERQALLVLAAAALDDALHVAAAGTAGAVRSEAMTRARVHARSAAALGASGLAGALREVVLGGRPEAPDPSAGPAGTPPGGSDNLILRLLRIGR